MSDLRRSLGALRSAGPALLLATTLGLAAWLYFTGEPGGRVLGFAQATTEGVAPTEIAKVASIAVSVGDPVAAGQVVATLDTAAIDAEMAVEEAEKARLEAEVRAEQSLLEQQLTVDLEGLERELARQREEQIRARAEEGALRGEVSRVKRLVEEQQAILGDLGKLDLQHATVKAIADEKPRTIGLLRAQIAAAEERRRTTRAGGTAPAAELEADLLLARRRMERLEQRRSGYVLRAAHGGRVAAIDKQPGEVAAAGEPIVRVVSARGRVVACVPERIALDVREGDAARLWVRGRSGAPLSGKAVALGPLVTELPARCRATPSLPAWGRDVTIALDPPVDLVAGQAFDVAFEPSQGAPPPPPPAAPPAASPAAPPAAPPPPHAAEAAGPVAMTVPPALLQRSRFEPSGLLARPSEARYLIASDDTGHEGDEGEPWLFAMSAGGAVDPEPVPVSGVPKLGDVEALAPGDAGEIYLVSSQSYSRKGKRKPARTAFLRLRPEGRGFRVDGEAHLAELIDAAGSAAAARLGLPGGTRSLDVEGLAFHGGALFLGVKAPLDARGEAMIWRVASPRTLFEAGRGSDAPAKRLEEAGISRWASARVDVELDGQRLPGGISDLLFLPDGSLAIASTPSTADGDAGALWRVDDAVGPGGSAGRPPEGETLRPRLLRRFPKLKPEGLAPALSPGKVMIVFDAGSGTPSFQEVPWDA